MNRPATCGSAIWPSSPCPANSWTSWAFRLSGCGLPGASADAGRLQAAIAMAAGCSDCTANACANTSACCGVKPARVRIRPTCKPSRVKVPVLSKTTVSTSARDSSACGLRTNTPARAKAPLAAIIAAGVASDKAQGHVTISTATPAISARCGSSPHHHATAAAAATSTTHKKGAAMRSANRARRGLVVDAIRIKSTISANRVLAPICVICTVTTPDKLKLPATTEAPSTLRTAAVSPVKSDSLACVWPSTMTPSAANASPGKVRMTSPTRKRLAGTRSNRIESSDSTPIWPSVPVTTSCGRRNKTVSGKRFIRLSSEPAV